MRKKAALFVAYRPFSSPLTIALVEEFKELGRAAGLVCEKVFYQVIKKPDPGFLIGSGKIQEIKEETEKSPVSLIVFEPSLSGVQTRNLEKQLQLPVWDRNQLILDIFAKRAHTYPGKLQVQLAQALDELPRMVGAWMSSLSRQGGGIGSKGPGEKAIEIDRRQIKAEVKKIKKKLQKIRQVRKGHRVLRKKQKIPTIALIGYTNSGKSTLLNTLTHKTCVQAQNLPFMTLDPTTRKIHIPHSPCGAVLTDTVGFIHNLSPHLIEAFKATLEESAAADILLHVIDVSSPLLSVQMETVHKLLVEFHWHHKPLISVYNKIDLNPLKVDSRLRGNDLPYGSNIPYGKDTPYGKGMPYGQGNASSSYMKNGATSTMSAPRKRESSSYNTSHFQKRPKVFISALKGRGLHQLKEVLRQEIHKLDQKSVELYFPKQEESHIYSLNRKALIQKKETSSLGTLCHAHIPTSQLKEWQKFIIKKA